jgi:hypothetical protein
MYVPKTWRDLGFALHLIEGCAQCQYYNPNKRLAYEYVAAVEHLGALVLNSCVAQTEQ